ncbi:DUF2946 domain-containing protein [soil metagenome]
MKWFRERIRHGSRLALLALAVQLVLSFGHFHAIAQPASAHEAIATTQSPTGSDPTPGHQHHPADDCAICAVMALAGTALAATPPILLLPQAAEFLYIVTDAEFAHLGDLNDAFQPRGPPLS